MPTTVKELYLGQPGTTITTLYTVPASTRTIVKQIIVCNTTSTPISLQLHSVPNGGSATTANAIIYNAQFTANSTTTFDLSMVMDVAGDTIRALQSAATSLTVNISGVEIV